MDRITFLDVLSWRHCSLAALNGYRAEHPCGDEGLAEAVLNQWPVRTDALARIVPVRAQAIRWMQGTRFATAIALGSAEAPPRPVRPGDHWVQRAARSWRGYFTVETDVGESVLAVVDIPCLHRINGMWEAVLVDTHREPPPLHRLADLARLASYTADAFRLMTGAHLGVRLLGPAYAHEELLDLPQGRLEALLGRFAVTRTLALPDPGYHCNSQIQEPGARERRWRCPLRQGGSCRPYGNLS